MHTMGRKLSSQMLNIQFHRRRCSTTYLSTPFVLPVAVIEEKSEIEMMCKRTNWVPRQLLSDTKLNKAITCQWTCSSTNFVSRISLCALMILGLTKDRGCKPQPRKWAIYSSSRTHSTWIIVTTSPAIFQTWGKIMERFHARGKDANYPQKAPGRSVHYTLAQLPKKSFLRGSLGSRPYW